MGRWTCGRGMVPAGLVGMIALVMAVEGFVTSQNRTLVDHETIEWMAAGDDARERAPGCTVLCFGDSLVKFGVFPDALVDRGRGGRAYNLAVSGGRAPSSYFLLRRAIRSGARPAAVVVDFAPHLLQHGPKYRLRQWAELLDAGELLDMIGGMRNATFSGQLVLSWMLPTIRARDEIRAILKGKGPVLRPEFAGLPRVRAENGGAQPYPKRAFNFGTVDFLRWEDFPRGVWSCDKANARYLRRFFALTQREKIPVVWLLPPVSPAALARRRRLGVEADFDRFVRDIQAEFPGVIVADGLRSGYDKALFMDPVHLDREGALALSSSLKPIVLAAAEGPEVSRWFLLPGARSTTLAAANSSIRRD